MNRFLGKLKMLQFNKIGKKFAFGVVLVMLISLFIFSYLQHRRVSETIDEDMKIKLETVSNLIPVAVSDAIWTYNVAGIEIIGDAFFNDKEVAFIRISDSNYGEVYFRYADNDDSSDDSSYAYSDDSSYAYSEKHIISVVKDIVYEDEKIGTVVIGLTYYYRDMIHRESIITRVIESTVLLVLLAGVTIAVARKVTKPLKALIIGTEEIAKGNYEKELFVTSKDEIGILSAKFNYMRESILSAEEESSQLNSELHVLNEELESRVSQRTEELSKTNIYLEKSLSTIQETQAELLEKNDMLEATFITLKATEEKLIQSTKRALTSQLVAGVAHEINTPLGVSLTVSTYLETLVDKFYKEYSVGKLTKANFENFLEKIRESSYSITKNIERAAELVRSFKQVAVDQTGEVKREFNLHDYIDSVMRSLHSEVKNTNYVINVDCPKDIFLNSYPGAISQIITNLLMNSLLHGFEERENGYIDVGFSMKDNILEMVYKDDGKGISKDYIDKIFEPFYTTRRGKGGSGLGLYITYNIVTVTLGGTISCISEVGVGTTFDIKVPMSV